MIASTQSLSSTVLRILKPHLALVIVSTLLGILNGLSVTALLALINQTLTSDVPPNNLALRFSVLCIAIWGCSFFSTVGAARVGQRVLADMRQEMSARILVAPITRLEQFGSHTLIPVLVHDTSVLSTFALSIAPLVVACTVTIGGIIYLAILSVPLVLITLVAMTFGLGAQVVAHRYGMPGLLAARAAEDDLQKQYEAISDGAKELRIHRPRRHRVLMQHLRGAVERMRDCNIGAVQRFIAADTFGAVLFFILIGLAIALHSLWYGTDKSVLGGFVLVMLYLRGPLETLSSALPAISNAQVALRRIVDLSENFSSPEPHLLVDDCMPASHDMARIELRGVCYEFEATTDGQPFRLGPLDLTIERGDIVFIVGENGSGKTTLIKLLLGLYTPQSGAVLLDGTAVSPEDRDDYRQLFTTIFSDYYLFDELPDSNRAMPQQALDHLNRMKLAHKVGIHDGRFTTTDLSTGQRKRLALINAWLEQRPVLLFDEWAADQDPAFRRLFYTTLLPELKAAGKTIIAVSHDDRYFGIADHIVHMECGRIRMERGAAYRKEAVSA